MKNQLNEKEKEEFKEVIKTLNSLLIKNNLTRKFLKIWKTNFIIII